MPLAGFEPEIPATKRPQTYALNCAGTGTGYPTIYKSLIQVISFLQIFPTKIKFFI
jgi:hypothetical protein